VLLAVVCKYMADAILAVTSRVHNGNGAGGGGGEKMAVGGLIAPGKDGMDNKRLLSRALAVSVARKDNWRRVCSLCVRPTRGLIGHAIA
jgi:hypothetical protein